MIINKHNVDQYIKDTRLICSNKSITSIEYIPEGIHMIQCSHNKLTKLPNLPNSLMHLQCSHNKLTHLPDLPDGLMVIGCAYNQLTQLPKLPKNLGYLYCQYNNLTSYPNNNTSRQWFKDHNNSLKLLKRSTTIKSILTVDKSTYDNK